MFKNKKTDHFVPDILGLIAWVFFFGLIFRHPIFASSAQLQQGTVESYGTVQTLKAGLIVQLDPANPENVIPATQANISKTFGIVVDPTSSILSIQTLGKSPQNAYVTSSGNYPVVVSDQNGKISAGDYLTLSAIDGIAMKDNTTALVIIGQATTSFNGVDNIIGSQDVVNTLNSKKLVHLGSVKANIAITHNPLLVSSSYNVPAFLKNFSKNVSGKVVSPWRIYIALILLLAICFIVGIMLYGAVRSSMIAIGRNPLSKHALSRGFIQIIVAAIIIFISGVFGVYLLLRV
jgi:hypothetical protein